MNLLGTFFVGVLIGLAGVIAIAATLLCVFMLIDVIRTELL